jgi:hypothetical protein
MLFFFTVNVFTIYLTLIVAFLNYCVQSSMIYEHFLPIRFPVWKAII